MFGLHLALLSEQFTITIQSRIVVTVRLHTCVTLYFYCLLSGDVVYDYTMTPKNRNRRTHLGSDISYQVKVNHNYLVFSFLGPPDGVIKASVCIAAVLLAMFVMIKIDGYTRDGLFVQTLHSRFLVPNNALSPLFTGIASRLWVTWQYLKTRVFRDYWKYAVWSAWSRRNGGQCNAASVGEDFYDSADASTFTTVATKGSGSNDSRSYSRATVGIDPATCDSDRSSAYPSIHNCASLSGRNGFVNSMHSV